MSDYFRYQVLREAIGGQAVSESEWGGFDPVKRRLLMQGILLRFDLTNEEERELREARGGCRCQDPGASPPCSTCTDPLSFNEAEIIALVRRAERAPVVEPEGWGDW